LDFDSFLIDDSEFEFVIGDFFQQLLKRPQIIDFRNKDGERFDFPFSPYTVVYIFRHLLEPFKNIMFQ